MNKLRQKRIYALTHVSILSGELITKLYLRGWGNECAKTRKCFTSVAAATKPELQDEHEVN